MRLPPLPDLPDVTSGRRLMLTALAVTLIVAVYLGVRDGPDLNLGYGDTDDAMRLVLARQLLHGRGWWDQKEMILQPPLGVYLHWSRLLDGGVTATAVYHFEDGGVQVDGPDPTRADYGSFLSFSDPDGNGWLVQEVPSRPG